MSGDRFASDLPLTISCATSCKRGSKRTCFSLATPLPGLHRMAELQQLIKPAVSQPTGVNAFPNVTAGPTSLPLKRTDRFAGGLP